MRRVTFHSEAEAEMMAAAKIYEAHRSKLGFEFVAEVQLAAKALVTYPSLGHRFSKSLRRVLVRRFPYGLLYRVEPERIFIVAVAHVRRRPGYWRSVRRR